MAGCFYIFIGMPAKILIPMRLVKIAVLFCFISCTSPHFHKNVNNSLSEQNIRGKVRCIMEYKLNNNNVEPSYYLMQSHFYDTAGNEILMVDRSGDSLIYKCEYNPNGWINTKTVTGKLGKMYHVIYRYNGTRVVESVAYYPDTSEKYKIKYVYDAFGNSMLLNSGGDDIALTYSSSGRLIEQLDTSGLFGAYTDYKYDTNGNPTYSHYKVRQRENEEVTYQYTDYDYIGNWVTRHELITNGHPNQQETRRKIVYY